RRGLISDEERYRKVIEIWEQTKDRVTQAQLASMDKFNPVFMMAHSGARGNVQQMSQLGGMRGVMVDPTGRVIEVPVRSSFREGLSVLEYFTSTHGARKGLADTALRTADSGYLTRRLVDVAQDVIVREEDCGTEDGILIEAPAGETLESVRSRVVGRCALEDVVHPETGEVLVRADEEIREDDLVRLGEAGITGVRIRSVLTCKTRHGVCVRCYGRNLATGSLVEPGEAV
ncbi:MAG: DNA-directed RNA polymerase subunit beta', partial [Chloroflexi bacterium]|nr:DNA-directed RNA polymerase subunit beta' [Chloroflexota bacterium]